MHSKNFLTGIAIALLSFAALTITAQDSLYLVFLNTNPDRVKLPDTEVAELQKGHLANIGSLYDQGDLLLAGPFDGGGGVFVLSAKTQADAEALLATDPAISANRFRIETYPMRIDKGMICRQDEPYEMVQFNFIQFTPGNPDGDGNWRAKELYDDHEKVVFAFSLNDRRFIEILAGESDAESYAKNHPLVLNGQYSYKILPWWSTSKTFCTDKNRKLNY